MGRAPWGGGQHRVPFLPLAGLVGRRNSTIEGGALSQLNYPCVATRKLLFLLTREP